MSTDIEPRALPDVIADLAANPDHALFVARAEGEITDGVRCTARIREHELIVDEPAMIGGTDTGPNPVELILAALGTCQAITYRVWAFQLGIQLDTIRFETEGDVDLRGFFGLDDAVRPGFARIRHHVTLVGPESEERYAQLTESVDRHCPVLDIVGKEEPVERIVSVARV